MLRAEMFGMGMGEILLILVVALLFLGPDKLPDAAKAISKGIRDLRKQTRELQSSLEGDNEIGSAIREIKGALRGDDLRIRPIPPLATTIEKLAQDALAAGEPGAVGANSATDSEPMDPTSADDLDIGADDHLPEAHERLALDESAPTATEVATEPRPDPDLPVIRPAAGAVAKSVPARAEVAAVGSATDSKDSSSHG